MSAPARVTPQALARAIACACGLPASFCACPDPEADFLTAIVSALEKSLLSTIDFASDLEGRLAQLFRDLPLYPSAGLHRDRDAEGAIVKAVPSVTVQAIRGNSTLGKVELVLRNRSWLLRVDGVDVSARPVAIAHAIVALLAKGGAR